MKLVVSIAQNVTVYNRTIEEGRSAKFECDSSVTFPFYYYRYFAEYINPPIIVEHTNEEYPAAVYAINASNSLTNLRTIPKFITRSLRPLTINNLTIEFHNNIICCQGCSRQQNDLMVASLSKMICYHLDVQCKCILLASYIAFIYGLY